MEELQQWIADAGAGRVSFDPYAQLDRAIRAVLDSWNGRRAIEYRSYHGIPHDLSTAVSVMSMVFGNLDDQSATGMLFTRDPSTGAKEMFGEYLLNAQGEDIVSGVETPAAIAQLQESLPEVYRELGDVAAELERLYRDVQDIEFTVERGRLFVLQTRSAKRSAMGSRQDRGEHG